MFQIDQSGKIEQTNKDTVIAYSNNNKYAVLIPRKLKRQVQKAFRVHGFTALFVYYLFSVGVFYLLEHLTIESDVIIDTEYPGKEKIIQSFFTTLLEKSNKPIHHISFARIGNRPPAHYAAKDVFDKKKKANRTLKIEDVLKALKKTDGRLRECFSTLVDARSQSLISSITQKVQKSKKGWRSRSSRDNP